MIKIDLQPEPVGFDIKVRRRGNAYLLGVPHPTREQWKSHSYWTEFKWELHDLYGGICAYSCHWIAYDTGWNTCEHFEPKHRNPRLAYEWSNYRLVCGTLNGRKGERVVLDPFTLPENFFVIDFPSLLVKPNDNLNDDEYSTGLDTCKILGLNDEDTCMRNRATYISLFCDGSISFAFLERQAPFLGSELRRQDLIDRIKEMMTN